MKIEAKQRLTADAHLDTKAAYLQLLQDFISLADVAVMNLQRLDKAPDYSKLLQAIHTLRSTAKPVHDKFFETNQVDKDAAEAIRKKFIKTNHRLSLGN